MNAQSNAAADGVNSPVVSMQAMTNATYLSCGRNKGYRQRQCILVTNNEVSEEENRTLTEQGFQPGQDEWEQHGICRSVTWPRSKFTMLGKRDDGAPLPGDYGLGSLAHRAGSAIACGSA